jgi:uncharacterized membrane protein YoaK (UPF0700 family)
MVADAKSVQVSYVVPCFCFVLIVIYGIFCHKRFVRMKHLSPPDAEGTEIGHAAGAGFI